MKIWFKEYLLEFSAQYKQLIKASSEDFPKTAARGGAPPPPPPPGYATATSCILITTPSNHPPMQNLKIKVKCYKCSLLPL